MDLEGGEGGIERRIWMGREGGKKKYIKSEKWRGRWSDKGEMKAECVCFGMR